MRKLIVVAALFLLLLFSSPVVFAAEEQHETVVTAIVEDKKVEIAPGRQQPYQKFEAEITSGELKGEKILAEQGGVMASNENQKVKVGDKVLLTHIKKIDGTDQFFFLDFVRTDQLLILLVAFVLAVIVVGGIRGAASFVGLIVSFAVLLKFIIPGIVSGNDPVLITIIGSFFILLTTLYLAHGISKKTTAAVLGTVISLIITGILASMVVDFTRLSGFGSEEAGMLAMFAGVNINLQGILLAGIIIGALGVLDDITVSQAACVFELNAANGNLSWRELYQRGLRVGRDHIASLVNTLVLAYAGASLPLLLLFAVSGGEPMNILLNREMIANEIVRTLVGSLGLVSAVPITTMIASVFCKRRNL